MPLCFVHTVIEYCFTAQHNAALESTLSLIVKQIALLMQRSCTNTDLCAPTAESQHQKQRDHLSTCPLCHQLFHSLQRAELCGQQHRLCDHCVLMVCSCLHSSSLLQQLLQGLLRSDSTAICTVTARMYKQSSRVEVSVQQQFGMDIRYNVSVPVVLVDAVAANCRGSFEATSLISSRTQQGSALRGTHTHIVRGFDSTRGRSCI
jgi:hypothetical protein